MLSCCWSNFSKCIWKGSGRIGALSFWLITSVSRILRHHAWFTMSRIPFLLPSRCRGSLHSSSADLLGVPSSAFSSAETFTCCGNWIFFCRMSVNILFVFWQ